MSDQHVTARRPIPDSERIGRRRELRRYIAGFALSLLLTLPAFSLAAAGVLPPAQTRLAVAGLALLQIVVHFRFFLHIDLQKSHRDDLMLILFTGLIIGLMVLGTLWILFDLEGRMLSP
ncbi:cytochrome o ubiquinol oxidase subunit IV [Zhengella mangrovi]|uniref:Cytochrome bo(3) ubiquinol oxidase subunit 4 n=1 Tax=Zhengella mangrovi TaxID=1982044 RepID=A0A2G1QSZ8_9HYPH|nr:cytochrome o ubiquinol oxidase subunit IV [Zhengella mangrovi]PHP68667.1 cytochrome o ubiquinol oxidase subunit IV [Zhengella mangrovi]